MSLQGTLDTFSVADVLPVLERGTKTGALRVRGETGSGILHLVDGRLVGAESEALRGAVATDAELRVRLLDVGFVLFREQRGTFEFDDSWRPPADSGITGVTVDEMLDRVGRVVADWSGSGDSCALDVDAPVALVAELASETVTLDRSAWRVVRAVGPNSTLRDVAAALGLSIVETSVALRAMTADGILMVGGTLVGSTGLRAPVTPAAFDPAAFDPASYEPADHQPVEWSARAGSREHATPGLGEETLALGADVAALQAAARDLRSREEQAPPVTWDVPVLPDLPVVPDEVDVDLGAAGYRPDRSSAFARLASERTEAEIQAQADAEAEAEAAARAGFALAVDDLLLPVATRADGSLDEATVAFDGVDFDPEAYAPLSFEAPPLTNLAGETPHSGSIEPQSVDPTYVDPTYAEGPPIEAEPFQYSESDYLAPDPGAEEHDGAENAEDDGSEAPRAGEPKDRGALLRMFSALREG